MVTEATVGSGDDERMDPPTDSSHASASTDIWVPNTWARTTRQRPKNTWANGGMARAIGLMFTLANTVCTQTPGGSLSDPRHFVPCHV